MYNKELELQNQADFNFNNKNTNIDITFAFKAITYLILVDKYRSNTYQNWLLDGFRLATLGNVGKLLFIYLSKESENYNESSCLDKFNECVKTTKMKTDSITYYYKLLKEKHGNKWIELVNSYK